MKNILKFTIILMATIVLFNSCNSNAKNTMDQLQTQTKEIPTSVRITTVTYEWSMVDECKNYKNKKLKKYVNAISFIENTDFNLLNKYNVETNETITVKNDDQQLPYAKYQGSFDTYEKLYDYMKKYCTSEALQTLLIKERVLKRNNGLYVYLGDTETWNYYTEKDVTIFSNNNNSVTVCVTRHMERNHQKSDLSRKLLYTFKENNDALLLTKISEIKEIDGMQKTVSVSYGW